jgi:hypothetical protein
VSTPVRAQLPALEARVGGRRGRLPHFLDENGLIVVVLGIFAVVMLATLRRGLAPDGWMALVSGREIVRHGLPSHDSLTIWANGRRWVDQQWLAQLVLYGIWRIGGLKLALFVHAALAIGALTGAAALARHLGASARSTTWICVPVLIAYYPGAAVLRPQSFAYPLFVAVFWLLVSDQLKPTRRVFVTLPLLVLWANLHGSVLLGAGLVSLAGIAGLARNARDGRRRLSWRDLALSLAPWLCVFDSPYALHLPSYYESVLGGRDFGQFVTEWAPTTLSVVTIPFYLLVLGGVWLFGRVGGRVTAFEKLAFVVLAVGGLESVRNIVWFGLCALIVLPRLVDGIRSGAPELGRLNRLLAVAVIVAVVGATAVVAGKGRSWLLADYPTAAAGAVAGSAGQTGTVLSTTDFADWLLWRQPGLSGRIAYDTRFELLTSNELARAARYLVQAGAWRATARPYRVFVLDRIDDRDLRRALVRAGIARVISVDGRVVVLRRTV